MSEFGNVAFDPETLAILEGVFDEAWVSIQAQRNGNITRAALAERILNLAVKGERNPARLLDGALSRSKKDVERDRLEKALEEGLRETFPASDAVAVVQHAHRDLGRTQAFDWDGLQNRLARHTSLISYLNSKSGSHRRGSTETLLDP